MDTVLDSTENITITTETSMEQSWPTTFKTFLHLFFFVKKIDSC